MILMKILSNRFETAAADSGDGAKVRAQVVRKGRAGLNPFPSPGVRKPQLCRVQKLPADGW